MAAVSLVSSAFAQERGRREGLKGPGWGRNWLWRGPMWRESKCTA